MSSAKLDKTYRPRDVEARHYKKWEEAGAFSCGRHNGPDRFSIVMPPPNVTGSLHVGHALDITLPDILVRFERMRGRDVLWQPGTDHAGIATQMVVERQLAEEGITRHDLGREAFVERVWEWKHESGGTITEQLRRLGASCDWPRERFTMDDGLSAAVRKVFVSLHRDGLIYRDKRLVNWDPTLHTAISDLEVEQREVQGHLWYVRYPIEGDEDAHITIATTRPETMLGDTAIAVHPEDERYQHLVGHHALLPLVGRKLLIIADEYSDPEKGTGAVKMTPAHDFNDFEVGRRHNLELVNIFDRDACLNDNVPEAYRGLDRYEARAQIVKDLEAQGLVERIEDHLHPMPHGDRSGTVIEPWLTDQWYVDAPKLAGPAIAAVREGRTRFVPAMWEKTYFQWMENIQPWCVSRQLWWGHRIPAWYGPEGEIFVAETEEEAYAQAREKHGPKVELEQDPDVLDTWFSSGLWAFTTLDWPDESEVLKRFYPTDLLVTGFDIIFFWVARMMMMSLYVMKEVPFRTVYIHALIRDAKGQKMSKSKGNVMDPLVLIDEYGADAVRFTLASMESQGRDIKLAEERIAGYRNFVTKLWNASRFCEMNGCLPDPDYDPAATPPERLVNKAILYELHVTRQNVTKALEEYRFNEAALALYQFTWGTFCDWHIEFTKPSLDDPEHPGHDETKLLAAWVLDQLLALLHPFMPFVTEELWERLAASAGIRRETPLILAPWPDPSGFSVYEDAARELNWIKDVISSIRQARSELNVPGAARLKALLLTSEASRKTWFEKEHNAVIKRMARLESAKSGDGKVPAGSAQVVVDEHTTVVLQLAGVIDLDEERARLARELDRARDEITKIDKNLANDQFTSKAPEHVIEEQRTRRSAAEALHQKFSEALSRLA